MIINVDGASAERRHHSVRGRGRGPTLWGHQPVPIPTPPIRGQSLDVKRVAKRNYVTYVGR